MTSLPHVLLSCRFLKHRGLFLPYYYTLQQARRILLVRNKLREVKMKISTKLIVH